MNSSSGEHRTQIKLVILNKQVDVQEKIKEIFRISNGTETAASASSTNREISRVAYLQPSHMWKGIIVHGCFHLRLGLLRPSSCRDQTKRLVYKQLTPTFAPLQMKTRSNSFLIIFLSLSFGYP